MNRTATLEEIIASQQLECRVATPYDQVYSNECCYTFHTPYASSSGIVINLNTFIGTIESMAMIGSDSRNNDTNGIFLRIVKEYVLKSTNEIEKDESKPTKLAIGVEGGFTLEDDKYETITKYSVVVLQQPEQQSASVSDDATTVTLLNVVCLELPYNISEDTDSLSSSIPSIVQQSVNSIIHHVGVAIQNDVQSWTADADDIPISKYCHTIPYIENGVTIDPNPTTWQCQSTTSNNNNIADDNLWLNLSDGYIGGGRKHWDGSGGTNGALDHYNDTGQLYPLVVKLGTITSDIATADCYSYAPDEDGPVQIPNLVDLLIKRGIKVTSMQKTVKSTTELEVELNATYAFDAITEAGTELQPLSGPGYQGLQNLGNSCYMNSIFQLLFSGTIPELVRRYGCGTPTSYNDDDAITNHPLLRNVTPTAAPLDVLCQTTKVACALTSGRFAKPMTGQIDSDSVNPKYRLAPRMIKHCIGKDHIEFRTAQQQDAAQFLQYYLERLDRAELGATANPVKAHLLNNNTDNTLRTSTHLFSFQTTERRLCTADNKVLYKTGAAETIWSLRIPMEKAVVGTIPDDGIISPEQKKLKSDDEGTDVIGTESTTEKKPVPSIELMTCIEEWANDTTIDNIRWSHLNNASHAATHNVRFTNFPRYLIVQMNRYELGPDWVPYKLEVNLIAPEDIDLTKYKSKGPQENEVLIPNDNNNSETTVVSNPEPTSATTTINEVALSQLMDMGFSLNSCKRALTAVGGNDVDAAMGWVFEHNTDPDFNDPIPDSSSGARNPTDDTVDEGVVQSLVDNLGMFTADQVRAALKTTGGASDRAADWLFSHMDDIDGAIAALNSAGNATSTATVTNSPSIALEDSDHGRYKLQGIVSHIGKNTGSGHYVAHLKDKDDRWVIFNDEKVAVSSKPPLEHAYLYFYQRSDTIGAPMNNF